MTCLEWFYHPFGLRGAYGSNRRGAIPPFEGRVMTSFGVVLSPHLGGGGCYGLCPYEPQTSVLVYDAGELDVSRTDCACTAAVAYHFTFSSFLFVASTTLTSDRVWCPRLVGESGIWDRV